MTITAQRIENEPIIVLTFGNPVDGAKDSESILRNVVDFKKIHAGKLVYRILDVSNINVGFSDMMQGMAVERGQEGGANDPQVATIFVGSAELVRFGVEALQQQEQYGKANVALFTSEAEALAYARSQLK